MSSLQQLEAEHSHALAAADSIISALERQKRQPTTHEQSAIDGHIRTANALKERITTAKGQTTSVRTIADARAFINSQPRERVTTIDSHRAVEQLMPKRFSREYLAAVMAYMSGAGPLNASLQESVSSSGGYAVPVVVDDQIVPLAPQDSAVRRLATVIPTKSDIKVPQVTARATVSAKSEGSAFGTATPTLGQFTLSAYAAGVEVPASFEAVQDFDVLNALVLPDVVSAFLEYEENLYVNGSGNGQAQGLLGNVDAGVTAEPDGGGNTVSCAGIRSLIGTLKESYALGASFLMTKSTALVIRASQFHDGIFEPAFTRSDNQDFLFGYPVAYSSVMPAASRGNSPVLLGDFRKGYIVGDRGGSALLVKVLDQAGAAQGLVNLLFYRRTDGRVRRSEAIKSYTISAS